MILSFPYPISTFQEMLNVSQSSALHTVSLACVGYFKVFLHCFGSASCLLWFVAFYI